MPSTVSPPSIKPLLDQQALKIKARIEKALVAAGEKLAENILQEGRSDISGAGNFGTRWTQGFTYNMTGQGKARTISFKHAVPYWRVFQYGAVIHGKPLLWIPLSFAGLPPGTRAAGFPGGLFRVNRKSGAVPLLLSVTDKQPKFHGQESVRIPKKFHLVEIMRSEAKTFGALYRLELAGG